MFELKDGQMLVKLARRTLQKFVESNIVLDPPRDIPDSLKEKRGVFVTINRKGVQGKELRGCIGMPLPEKPLIVGVIENAINAGTQDPRFPPVNKNELDSLIFEVSILTKPRLLKVDKPEEYPNVIKVGRDGLIVEHGRNKGLLLPQVPVEQGWDELLFLGHACHKAWLPETAWLDPQTRIYTFQAIVFEETIPNGKIKQRHDQKSD